MSVYTGLLDEDLDDEQPEDERRDLFLPPFLDRLLAFAAVALIVLLLGAIAVRSAYGPDGAVAVLWATWSAVLIGLICFALRPASGRHRKAWR